MSYIASSTKERYDELQKNPLVFVKYGQFSVEDEMGFSHSTEGWSSCDPTIQFVQYQQDLPKNESGRRLFVVGNRIFPNGEIDEKKEDKDIVEFEVTEFDTNKPYDWSCVLNDCWYNYRSGNTRHCHMALFWALYTTTWEKETVHNALSLITKEAAQNACNYISANIFVLSVNKQYILVELLRGINPNIQPLGIPDVEAALRELAPTKDFNSYGFFQKIDFILKFGTQADESVHLQSLFTSSLNGWIHFKYWMKYEGHKFFNYNFLEVVYSYVDTMSQLSIVKRYLHDVRLNLIQPDYSLIQNLRDIRHQAFVDIRYFITNPGDNIHLAAPMFCDTLLTLNRTKGERIQDFNGILDFAIAHSNKAYPNIDLGIKYILPTCDGGLKHNSSFCGFIHYVTIYTFDESSLTDENLKRTAEFFIRRHSSLQNHYCCKFDQSNSLDKKISEQCSKVGFEIKDKLKDGKKIVEKKPCTFLLYQPILPHRWVPYSGTENIFNMMIDHLESKQYITENDINIQKLRNSLLLIGKRLQSYSFENGEMPENISKNEDSRHFIQYYYKPTVMKIYPNEGIFYSRKKSFLGAWDDSQISTNPEQGFEEIAQKAEGPIVYKKTFESLKQMYPDAEIGQDHITLPYDYEELENIKAFFYFHSYSSGRNSRIWNKEFLTPKMISGIFYCTPKLADSLDKVSNLPFFWCRSEECFCNMLDDQTLDKQKDWRKYSLYHASEILGYKLIRATDKGNVPLEAVSNFAGEVRQAERMYSRLICRSCGHMIFSIKGSILAGSRTFSCINSLCSQYRIPIYLSQCSQCKKGLIDSRDSKKCENGWVICPSCLACCNDNLIDSLIAKHRRNGWIPPKLQESQGRGHNNKNMFFCPQCGTKLGDIKLEETVKLDDGSEDVITHNVFGCPQCNKSYEKELEKFTKARTQ